MRNPVKTLRDTYSAATEKFPMLDSYLAVAIASAGVGLLGRHVDAQCEHLDVVESCIRGRSKRMNDLCQDINLLEDQVAILKRDVQALSATREMLHGQIGVMSKTQIRLAAMSRHPAGKGRLVWEQVPEQVTEPDQYAVAESPHAPESA